MSTPKLIGIITAIFPLKNTIEFKCARGTFYYYKPKFKSVRTYKVGQRFTYTKENENE